MERSDDYRSLPSGAWRLIAALWELADSPRGSEPWVHGRAKRRTIAERSGLSESQVGRWLRRLRVVDPGQETPPGHLGGWLNTHTVAGRFLAFTVYATPNGKVVKGERKATPTPRAGNPARTPPTGLGNVNLERAEPTRLTPGRSGLIRLDDAPKRDQTTHRRPTRRRPDAPPDDAGMRGQVAHGCALDIPPQVSTSTNHHQHPQTPDDAGRPSPGDGGGGGEPTGELTEHQKTFLRNLEAEREQVRRSLLELGVFESSVDELVELAGGMPNGWERIQKTAERLKGASGKTNTGAVIASAIRKGMLDPLTEQDVRKIEAERKQRLRVSERINDSLEDGIERLRAMAADGGRIPPMVCDLLGWNGTDRQRQARTKLSDKEPDKRIAVLLKLEDAMRIPPAETFG